MQVKLIDLKGQAFNLEFEEESGITVQSIRQKLLKEYNFDSSRCYFCRSGKVLQNEKITKEAFAKSPDLPIVIFDSRSYPDKSYPKVDDAFQWNFSRYDDSYLNSTRPRNFVGDGLSEDDFSYQIGRLISHGIIHPSRIFSQIFSMARSRNNQNFSGDIRSDSDDENEQHEQQLQNRQTYNFNLDPDVPFPINDPNAYTISHDFLPSENALLNAFYIPDHQQDDDDQIYQNYDDDVNFEQNEQQDQNEQQQVDNQEQQQIDDGQEIDPDFHRMRLPFQLNLERRQDELNQQIIEGLGLNIQLNDNDSQAISRLVQNGYDRATVIQVYEACDRNEEAAMNLLVSMEV